MIQAWKYSPKLPEDEDPEEMVIPAWVEDLQAQVKKKPSTPDVWKVTFNDGEMKIIGDNGGGREDDK